MTSGSSAKLHHYVPQGYLRGFATGKERITAIPLDLARKPFTTSVKNVAAQTHFHTVDGHEQPDAFEKALGSVEGDAIGLIRRIQGGEFPLPEEDRMVLSFYLALQAVRGPDTRRTIENLQAKITRVEVGAGGRKNVGKWIRNNLGFEATAEQEQCVWDEATQPGGPPIKLSNLAHIRHMVATAEDLAKYFVTRPWLLVRFDKRSLITSDAPVSLIGKPTEEPWQGVGFGTAWGIAFPITRKLGLLMSDPMAMIEQFELDDPRIQTVRAAAISGRFDRVETGSTKMERMFNEYSAANAREYLYRHPDDAAFVPDDLPEPTLVNMEVGGFTDTEFDGKPWFPAATSSVPAEAD